MIDTEGTSTDDGLVDFSKDEDSGAFTFSLTNLVMTCRTSPRWLAMTEGTQVASTTTSSWTLCSTVDVTFTPRVDQLVRSLLRGPTATA